MKRIESVTFYQGHMAHVMVTDSGTNEHYWFNEPPIRFFTITANGIEEGGPTPSSYARYEGGILVCKKLDGITQELP